MTDKFKTNHALQDTTIVSKNTVSILNVNVGTNLRNLQLNSVSSISPKLPDRYIIRILDGIHSIFFMNHSSLPYYSWFVFNSFSELKRALMSQVKSKCMNIFIRIQCLCWMTASYAKVKNWRDTARSIWFCVGLEGWFMPKMKVLWPVQWSKIRSKAKALNIV